MPLTFSFHPKAFAELDDALNWYFKKGESKLASQFLSDYQKLIGRILENPTQLAISGRGIHIGFIGCDDLCISWRTGSFQQKVMHHEPGCAAS